METNSEVIYVMLSLLVLTMSTAAVSDKQKVYSMNILQSKLNVMKYEEVTSIRRIFVLRCSTKTGIIMKR